MIISGNVLVIDRPNIDTDQIIPAHFLTGIDARGLGAQCMSGMPDGAAHLARVPDAKIMVVGENFGCGSSREHAAWALCERGFRAIIAPSFARIFLENAYNNALVPVIIDPARLPQFVAATQATIDVENETASIDGGTPIAFALDPLRKAFITGGGFLPYLASKIPLVRAWDIAWHA
jgi:3-isopropylmalate/(R)-2-methylmalate dehydratase small subunit